MDKIVELEWEQWMIRMTNPNNSKRLHEINEELTVEKYKQIRKEEFADASKRRG